MAKWLVVVALLGAACVKSGASRCADEAVCPEGTECVAAAAASGDMLNLCVDPTQITCGPDDGIACTFREQAGTCHGGACIPDECGNRLRDVFEMCDDGNNASGDTCSADCTSTEACGNLVIDSVTGEQCDEGDFIGHDGCASACRLESPIWSLYAYLPGREKVAMTFDRARGRVIAFGGSEPTTGTPNVKNDTRLWTGTRWETLSFALTPPAVEEQRLVDDEERRNVVLFGGTSPATWLLDPSGWRLSGTNTSPPARKTFGMVYDSKLKRVVAFGGQRVSGGTIATLGDTWVWDGAAWSELTGPGPDARQAHAMAFDRKRGVVVVFGGTTSAAAVGAALSDVWELDGTTWTKRSFSGGPAARIFAEATWDPITERVLVVGGRTTGSSPTYYKDAWEWNGSSWTLMAPVPIANAQDLGFHRLATDVARRRIVLASVNGTYEFDAATWTPRSDAPMPTASGRAGARAVLDPVHREIIIVGGYTTTQSTGFATDTLVWNGEWLAGPTADHPSGRAAFGFAYDPIRDEAVLFGGETMAGNNAETYVYRHRTARTWTKLSPATSPEARSRHALAWDGNRGSVLLFGGVAGGVGLNDTWLWDGTTWTKELPTGSPPPRSNALMTWDPVRRRVILHGGLSESNVTLFDDTWAWDGTRWSDISGQVRPPPREFSSMAFDPGRGRVVLSGGLAEFIPVNDTWELVGDRWKLVPVASPPAPRLGHVLAPSPEGTGIWMFGGGPDFTAQPVADALHLHWDAATVAQETCIDVDTDGDGLIGCMDPDCTYLCAPLCAPREMSCTSSIRCGDGTCDPDRETCALCPGDCGPCATP